MMRTIKKMSEKVNRKLDVLATIAREFNKNKITWALGASGMLYFRKVISEFNDLDLLVLEEDALKAKAILMKLGKLQLSEKGSYATTYFYQFIVDEVEIDLIAGFKIIKDDIIYNCNLKKEEIRDSILVEDNIVYLDSLENWLYYYTLMKRDKKVLIIKDYLKENQYKTLEENK